MDRPTSSYLICANQRSGSTLLCRALSYTGVAGHPEEYFLTGDSKDFPPGWAFWERSPLARRHAVNDRDAYLELVESVGSTSNGVFGAKLMWNYLPRVVAMLQEVPRLSGLDRVAVLRAAFPGLRAVHLRRRDLVRQAVSWARAAQDGVWVVSNDEPARPIGSPTYDFQFIAALESLLVKGETGWRGLYQELAIVPYEVVYEDLSTDEGYSEAIRGILRHLGLDDANVPLTPPLTNSRQTRPTTNGSTASARNAPADRPDCR